MVHFARATAILAAFVLIGGCTCNLNLGQSFERSGTLNEPYEEDDLTSSSADKRPFLETTNEVVAAIAQGDVVSAHAFMDPAHISIEKLEPLVAAVTAVNGRIVEYLPGQWWFATEKGYLKSLKLLVQADGCGLLQLTFLPSDPAKAVGFWMGTTQCSPAAEQVRLANQDAN